MPPPPPPAPTDSFTPGLILNAVFSLVILGLVWSEMIAIPESLHGFVKTYYAATSYSVVGALSKAGMLGWCLKAAVVIAVLPLALVWQVCRAVYDATRRVTNQRRFMATLERKTLEKQISQDPNTDTQPSVPSGGNGPAGVLESIPESMPESVIVSTFQYEPLEADDEIRLLELLPIGEEEKHDTPLRGRIVHARLADYPSYTALSYCWNDLVYDSATTSRVDPVLDFGEKGILVLTRNLFTGLRCAQKRASFNSHSHLVWIDQICINQQDLIEKSVQVALMKDIYRQATLILVWLGDDTPTRDGERALRFADRISACIDEKDLLSPEFDFFPITFTSNDLGLPPIHTAVAEYMSLATLLTRPWFARSWVVQEVSLGNDTDKRVLVGEAETSFDAVTKALLFCTNSIDFLMDLESKATSRAMIQSSVFATRDHGRPSSALLDILVRHRGCKATLARDKVFAFLNISTDGETLDIKADYTVCTRKVMIDTAVAVMTHGDNLDMLSSANAWPDGDTNGKSTASPQEPGKESVCMDGTVICPHSDHGPSLPSWVPDWSVPSFAPSFQSKGEFGEYFSDYRAAGTSVKEVQFRENNTQLGLKGHLIDHIVAVGPGFVEVQGLDIGSYYRTIKGWGDMCGVWDSKKKRKKYVTNEEMLNAFVNTLTCGGRDVTVKSSKPTPMMGKSPDASIWLGDSDFIAQFNQLMAVFQMNWFLDNLWPGIAARPIILNTLYIIIGFPVSAWLFLLAQLGLGPSFASVSSGFRQRFFKSVNHRRFIRTSSGFIGLASPQVRPDDWVAVFAGGAVPIVVREAGIVDTRGPLLEVVGDAYVHGLMFGDAWDMETEPQMMWFS